MIWRYGTPFEAMTSHTVFISLLAEVFLVTVNAKKEVLIKVTSVKDKDC